MSFIVISNHMLTKSSNAILHIVGLITKEEQDGFFILKGTDYDSRDG